MSSEREAIGRNNPPPTTHADLMMEESAAHRVRAEELATTINNQRIPSSVEEAARLTAMANLAISHKKTMNAKREELKRPHDDLAADVQRAFQPWISDLQVAIERARGWITAYNDHQEEIARAAQRAADQAAEEERKKAKQLETAAQRQRAAGDEAGALRADLDAIQATDRAQKMAAAPAVATALGAVRTQVGMASRSAKKVIAITDVNALGKWLMTHQREKLMEALHAIVMPLVRVKIIPDGVKMLEQPTTRFSR